MALMAQTKRVPVPALAGVQAGCLRTLTVAHVAHYTRPGTKCKPTRRHCTPELPAGEARQSATQPKLGGSPGADLRTGKLVRRAAVALLAADLSVAALRTITIERHMGVDTLALVAMVG